MGNEGSVPTSEDEFESQARAPPSAIDPVTSQSQSIPLPPPPLLPHLAGGGVGGSATTTGRSGRMINAVFHRRQSQQPSAQQLQQFPPGAPALTAEDMVLMSPEQQQLYYQEQQDHYEQQLQLQQQQYYNPNGYATTAGGGTGAAAPPSTSSSSATTTTPTKKSGLNFRPTGRAGAAILNSMKHLSLGNSSRGINNNKTTTTQDWETRWDEDDDSDEGAAVEDQLQRKQQPAHPLSAHPHAPPLVRPGMDLPPSISTPATTTVAMATATLIDTTTTKPHLVTATPEQAVAEDGVEWDTGVYAPVGGEDYEKPNVQMFLPLLRVLGKGSFGKVCIYVGCGYSPLSSSRDCFLVVRPNP